MAIVNHQLITTQLDALTVPAGKRYAITNIMVCNSYSPSGPSAASRDATFDLHLIPNGSAKNDQVTIVVKELTLPAGETFTFDSEKIVLDEGDIIAFVASPDIGSGLTDLATTVSYLEV